MARPLIPQSWGRIPVAGPARVEARDWRFENLTQSCDSTPLLAHGAGRSYGDSCINSDGIQLATHQLNRFITFDTDVGTLCCDAGVTLGEILALIIPRGWFLPVVPGTQFVTLGGAIANDIHGKNHHHAGSFGCHVVSLELLRSDGGRHQCSPQQNEELFAATVGGLGLTGLITRAEVRLRPLVAETMLVENLVFDSPEAFERLSRESADWEYTVSWVDVFARGGQVGRGIFSRARHTDEPGPLTANNARARFSVPFAPPLSLVNTWSVDLFNRLYFSIGRRRQGRRKVHYQPFFFPLDAIGHWNRAYGRHGFYQYQCVLPHDTGIVALHELLNRIAGSGEGSFLVVLKEFGARRSPGLLSFPRPGFTLALDFANRGSRTLRLLDALDDSVMSAGGALYPAKDARMSGAVFRKSFPNLERFGSWLDPAFSSNFWRRVTTDA